MLTVYGSTEGCPWRLVGEHIFSIPITGTVNVKLLFIVNTVMEIKEVC